jgi:hypothetical protein
MESSVISEERASENNQDSRFHDLRLESSDLHQEGFNNETDWLTNGPSVVTELRCCIDTHAWCKGTVKYRINYQSYFLICQIEISG